MRRLPYYFGLLILVVSVTACQGGPLVGVSNPKKGDQSFVSAAPGSGARGGYGLEDGVAGTNGQQAAPSTEAHSPDREIEEADLVKVVGSTLYALNSYRGLFVIDMSSPDHPSIVGHLDLYGYPVEMYVRDGRAYVILTNYFRVYCLDDEEEDPEVGSSVTVLDVVDQANPYVLSSFHMPGYVTDTRIVGDVLYAVSNRYSWFWYYDGGDEQDTTTVMSINVADPFAIRQMDSFTFQKCEGWDNHIHVTQQAVYVASSCWDYDSYHTQIRYVDISDPAGHMALGAQVEVPGIVRDRWGLDEYEGVLRVLAADNWWGGSAPSLFTFQVNSATDIRPLATMQLVMPQDEQVMATRFDGPRGYVVTYRQIDPLFALDLSDPAHPMQMGELEMPGWVDHIVPRGDRLVALGHDDSGDHWRLSVSLFDVSDLNNPALLDRVSFGEGWSWLTDERDNFEKVFKVLDDLNLILVPFMQWVDDPHGWGHYAGGVQLIDFTRDSLALRGQAPHRGYIRRALMLGDRLVTLSDQHLEVLDITDRDHPRRTGQVSLSRNVTQLAVVNGYSVQLVGDWYSSDTSIVVLPLSNVDLGEPVAELYLPAPYGKLFTSGNHVFVVYRDADTGRVTLQSIDLNDPRAPRLAGSLVLPEDFDSYGYYYGWWYWGGWYPYAYDSVVKVADSLVFHSAQPYWDVVYEGGEDGADGDEGGQSEDRRWDELAIVDLSNPDSPALVSRLVLNGMDWVAGLRAAGDQLVFTHYEYVSVPWDPERSYVRYYFDRVDLSDPAAPALAAPVNVPGYVLSYDQTRGLLYTTDYQYAPDGSMERTFNSLEIHGNIAVLLDRIVLPDNATLPLVSGSRAVFVVNDWWYDEDTQTYGASSALQSIDLSAANRLRLGAARDLPVRWAVPVLLDSNRLVLGASWYVSGALVYDVSNLNAPHFLAHLRTDGWISDVIFDHDTVYVATGPYGVHRLDL